ncbi:hypothetical protein AO392_04845 [Pseudomonas putida]|uniref:CbrC family protein n=1 Tax=Pseudomonas TaxID=286 RepID=UPI000730DF81|nr:MULTISPECIES: CbrC family protein [Pseudomonas]KTC18800.1 hypothetical protein AO392_04845 [Pseudomonas putida]WKL67036.1 CbrC family protein [Pseudomonas qingdaonensis]
MTTPLPVFTYYPGKVHYIVASSEACVCCGQARGYLYDGTLYTAQTLEGDICPWCIADGSAARRYDGSFHDVYTMGEAGIKPEVLDEIAYRTPGYPTWQDSQWMHHCGDACEFHGDASAEDISEATPATREHWAEYNGMTVEDWSWAAVGYAPGGDTGFYKFVCRGCKQVLLAWDMS